MMHEVVGAGKCAPERTADQQRGDEQDSQRGPGKLREPARQALKNLLQAHGGQQHRHREKYDVITRDLDGRMHVVLRADHDQQEERHP